MEIFVIATVVLIGAVTVIQYNLLKRADIAVNEALGQIDVQLTRRFDLIPNLVDTVKGYAAHERATFDAVTAARGVAQAATSVGEKAAGDGMLTQALRGLLAVAEAYPDLKASANFLALQEELAATENKIGFARQYYNDRVRNLNNSVSTFPGLLFAGLARVSNREFYEVEDTAARRPPTVSF
jgi:LemA protein